MVYISDRIRKAHPQGYRQCCGPGSLSRIRIFSIPNPGSSSKNLSILTQKIVSKLSEISPRLFIPDPDFLTTPDPGVKKAPDPGYGSATLAADPLSLKPQASIQAGDQKAIFLTKSGKELEQDPCLQRILNFPKTATELSVTQIRENT
jgi:hypothetical protein